LRDLQSGLTKTQETRISVYLALLGAGVAVPGLSGAGLGLSEGSNSNPLLHRPFVGALVALCILSMGVIIFVRMAERVIEAVIAVRGIRLFPRCGRPHRGTRTQQAASARQH
jgi:hypothetical protein